MTRWIAVGLVAAGMGAAGCAKPAGTDAEVPKAGPAAKPAPDAGPAPAGQSEPGGEKPAESTPAATPAGEAKSGDAPQTSTSSSNDVQLVTGTEERQRVVAVKPRGSGAEFSLVYVNTRS